MQMAWDVCPQIFAQSRRRWSSNWYSSHLAEFQSINYFRFFSEVIECNCDSFALINRMQMPRWGNTMPATAAASRLEVISKTKAYADSLCADLHCSLAVPFKSSLSLPLSLSLSLHRSRSLPWWLTVSLTHSPHFIAQQIKYDSEDCRHNGEC